MRTGGQRAGAWLYFSNHPRAAKDERGHMTEGLGRETLRGPVHEHLRTDFVQLHPDLTVAQALELILEKQPAGRIIYFYVADSEGRLQGVVPTRSEERRVGKEGR